MPTALPKLVLLPGLDGTGRFFARLERELKGRLNVQVIAYPSDPAFGYAELPDYVRDKIGTELVVVLGESYSGPVALRLGAQNPNQVKGVILAATFLTPPWPKWMLNLSARGEPGLVPRGWIDAILRGGAEDRELGAEIASVMAGFDGKVRSARLRAVAGVDARADFARVSCPILALHGQHDWLVWPGPMRRAIGPKAGARWKLLAGPHMLLQNNPGEAARAIEAFVKKIGSGT